MDIEGQVVDRYRSEGLWAVLRRFPDKIANHSPLAPHMPAALGEEFDQKCFFFARHGYWPQFQNPQSFNEKIWWRKLYTDDSLYTRLADKWAVREYVQEKVGDHVLNEVYHVTDDPTTIPYDELPDSFVLKSTHGSGHVTIVENKHNRDFEALTAKSRSWLSERFGSDTNEYWYGRITPRILVEEYIDTKEKAPRDFKFYVFDGRVAAIHVDMGRFTEHTRRFYDRDWNSLECSVKYPVGPVIARPEGFEKMRAVAEAIGEDLDFARVDLYNPSGDNVVFGEITLSPGAGREPFSPKDRDFQLGSYWNLNQR